MAITHNPFMDKVSEEALHPPPPSDLLKGAAFCVLFVSQPLAEMAGVREWPFDQENLLQCLLTSLSSSVASHSCRVLVWPHPAENIERWADLERFGGFGVGVELMSTDERGASILAHVDLVVSSHSTVAYEAFYYGTPCVSLRPGGERLPPVLSDILGLSRLCLSTEELSVYLANTNLYAERARLLDCKQRFLREQVFFTDGRATERVVAEVYRMLL